MAYWDFSGLLYSFDYRILTDAILPFALIFTILFSVLQTTKILGVEEDKKTAKKKLNIMIALVMSLGAVIPHLTHSYTNPSWDVVSIINKALPNVSLVAVIVVMILLVLGLAGKTPKLYKSDGLGGGFTILAIVVVVGIFLAAADVFDKTYLPSWLYFIYDPQFQALVVALVIFGLIIKFITGEDKEKDDKDKKKFLKNLNKIYDD